MKSLEPRLANPSLPFSATSATISPPSPYLLSSLLFSALAITPRSSPLDAPFLCDGGVPGDTSNLPLDGGEGVLGLPGRLLPVGLLEDRT